MIMFGLNETIHQLAMAYSVHCYVHAVVFIRRQEEGSLSD